MFKIENETDLHHKVVEYIKRFYPDAILIAGLGENQDTPTKRINSLKKGYMKGQAILSSRIIIKSITASTLNSRAPQIIIKSVKLGWR